MIYSPKNIFLFKKITYIKNIISMKSLIYIANNYNKNRSSTFAIEWAL